MGSSCSILNDTQYDVWITHGADVDSFGAVLCGLQVLAGIGAGVAELKAAHCEAAERRYLHSRRRRSSGELSRRHEVSQGEQSSPWTSDDWTQLSQVLGLTNMALAEVLNVSRSEAEKIRSNISEFQASAERIKPGNKYTWHGTLSLTKRVYVMNEKLQFQDRACLTGATADSENLYTISEHFKDLDVYQDY